MDNRYSERFAWGAFIAACALVVVLAFTAPSRSLASTPANITNTVGVCDPNFPQRCIAPATDGSIVVSGPALTGLAVTGVGPTLSTNSSTANLGGGAVFTGTAVDVTPYASVTVSIMADQNSASNGLSIQQSPDGTNWDNSDAYTITANVAKTVAVQVYYPFLRVVYTNGATPTTALRLVTMGHSIQGIGSSVRPSDAMTFENDMGEVIGFNALSNGTTADLQRSVTGASAGTGLGVAAVAGVPTSSANQGLVPVVSTALESCRVLKASAGNLYSLAVTIQATSGVVQIFNSTTAPADGAVTPIWSMPVLSNGTFGGSSWSWNIPLRFSTGATVCFSSATTPFTKTASATAMFSGGVQ